MLKEWHRVLKPNGKLVLELPDLDKCIKLVAENKPFKSRGGEIIPGMVIGMYGLYGDFRENRPEMTHKWGWSQNQLRYGLELAGFREITFPPAQFHYKFRDMRVECVK